MNYESVQSIIDSGTVNMTVLRNNSAQDDGFDTIEGVDWFTFNGAASTSIYVSGNSFIGFGSSSENLKINRRDTKMFYLYREEGTLYNQTKFLKLKWIGYSPYNSTSDSNRMEYDVLLFDNGSIMVYMHDFSITNDGVYSLVVGSTTYSYSISESSPVVTFYLEGSAFVTKYEVAKIYLKKFLIRVGREVFTKVDNVVTSLGEIDITADLFLNSGFDIKPVSDDLTGFENPDVLLWYNSEDDVPGLTATVKASPKNNQQIITNAIDLTHPSITGIENMVATCEGDLIIAVSFDGKQTWKAWNGSEWSTLSEEFTGMNKEALEAITFEQWNLLFQGATSFYIRISLVDTTQSVTEIYVDFAN